MKTILFSSVVFCSVLFGQEKQIPLESGSLGSMQVRPMTFTRAVIEPKSGATLLINSPYTVEVAILNPSNQRINASNASSFGLTFDSKYFNEEAIAASPLGAGFVVAVQFPTMVVPGNWRLELTSTRNAPFDAQYVVLDSDPIRLQIFTKNDGFVEGQDAVLSAALFDESIPVSGASIAVSMECQRDVSSLVEVVDWTPLGSTVEGNVRIVRSQLRLKSNAVGNLNDLVFFIDENMGDRSVSPSIFSIGQLTPGQVWTSPEVIVRQPRGPFDPNFFFRSEARGARQTFSLLDSGDQDSDGEVGDGLYGVKVNLSNSGICAFTATASGTRNGVAYDRSAYVQLPVTPMRGRIGGVQDYSVDADHDGKPEVVGFSVAVSVRKAGVYQLRGRLEKGVKYVELENSEFLLPGSHTMTLQASAEDLRIVVGESGPFKRSGLILTVNGDSRVKEFVDRKDTAGQTAAWQLGGTPIGVVLSGTPTLTASPLPLPPTGYKELKFSIPIQVLRPGTCAWQVRIATQSGSFEATVDEFFEATGTMPFSYTLTGSIPGWKIRRAQAGGYFKIAHASVNCGGRMEKWYAESLARSDSYRSADFENPLPSFELSFDEYDRRALGMVADLSRTDEFFFNVEALAGFNNNLACTASPSYPGVALTFDRMPSREEDWPIKVLVHVTPDATVGPSPITISCVGRGVTKTALLDLMVY